LICFSFSSKSIFRTTLVILDYFGILFKIGSGQLAPNHAAFVPASQRRLGIGLHSLLLRSRSVPAPPSNGFVANRPSPWEKKVNFSRRSSLDFLAQALASVMAGGSSARSEQAPQFPQNRHINVICDLYTGILDCNGGA
jgi:hypothetical protein